jgi:hypothetical protein
MRTDLASIALRAVVQTMGDREPMEYRRGQVVHELRGVFQASHVALDPETGVQVRSTQPVLLINGADLPLEPKQGDTVVARSITYRVRDSQPDGHGGWLLMLHRSNAVVAP